MESPRWGLCGNPTYTIYCLLMPVPDPYGLSNAYFEAQIERCRKTLEQIAARPDSLRPGRVIPGHDDLRIHDGRRLDASVMFLDICEFSGIPSSNAEEQASVLQILSFFFTEMIRIIEDYGGVVEKNTGDGLMAYFADTKTPEISIQTRAVTAALTMFAAAKTIINPVLARSGLTPLAFRICIDHGPITIAKVGAARGFNGIVAIGTTANIAAKMLAVAGRDTILIGTQVLNGLPQSWLRDFVVHETSETGWVWRETQEAYDFWRYTARWIFPLK